MATPDDDAGQAGDGGFLSRWSRRKVLVRQGVAAPEPAPSPPHLTSAPLQPAAPHALLPAAAEPPVAQAQAVASPPAPLGDPPPAAAPAPTLADVALLDHQSDFSRFVAPGVDTGVKNAALKKLFTDPHFNVMDRLDTYIDDYGLPDPLPPGMLRQMAQSQFLGLFCSDADVADADAAPPLDGLAAAEPSAAEPAALPAPPCDEDPALRLQPLDDAGPAGPDPGPGPDPGRQH